MSTMNVIEFSIFGKWYSFKWILKYGPEELTQHPFSSFEYHVSEIVALKLLPAKTKVRHYDINDLYRDILKGALYRIIFIILRKRAREIRRAGGLNSVLMVNFSQSGCDREINALVFWKLLYLFSNYFPFLKFSIIIYLYESNLLWQEIGSLH